MRFDLLFYVLPIVCGALCWSLFCYALRSVLSTSISGSVDIFSYSGPSGILASDGKQNVV